MGVDFKIVCEYKINEEWKLLDEDTGFGELNNTEAYEDYGTRIPTFFWQSTHWTGVVLRSLISNEQESIQDVCSSTMDALDYLSSHFYKITMNRLGFECIEYEDIEYVKEILDEFIKVKDWVERKYDPEEVRLVYVRY